MRGFAGIWGVGMKVKSSGWVHKRSSVRTSQSTIKSPWSVKCKQPTKVTRRPSRKSYEITGTWAPSK